MSKKSARNWQIGVGVILDAIRIWRSRPNRLRDWQVIATWGGATFTLRKTRENQLPEKLAGNYRIVYIDSVHGLVFVDDGSRPGGTKSNINP